MHYLVLHTKGVNCYTYDCAMCSELYEMMEGLTLDYPAHVLLYCDPYGTEFSAYSMLVGGRSEEHCIG